MVRIRPEIFFGEYIFNLFESIFFAGEVKDSLSIVRVLKKDPFVALTYFIPLFLLTFLAPLIAIKALLINPLFLGISPLFYIMGITIVSLSLYAQYNFYDGGKHGKYMLLWSALNMTILSYVLIYAMYDLRNMGWGTRWKLKYYSGLWLHCSLRHLFMALLWTLI